MSTVATILVSLERMEREQKMRDEGIRRALDLYANEFRRLQRMVGAREAETHQLMEVVTDLLTRQNSLVESFREEIAARGLDDDDGWDDLPAGEQSAG